MKIYLKKTTKQSFEELSQERREEIILIKDNITLTYNDIFLYGKDISKNMQDFSTKLLNVLYRKSALNVNKTIDEVSSKISNIDTKKILKKKSSIKELTKFTKDYNDISLELIRIKSDLKSLIIELQKDIEICNKYEIQNNKYIDTLEKYIIAGQLKLEEIANLNKEDLIRNKSNIEFLGRKINDLKTVKIVAMQNIPMINLIRQTDYTLIERLNETINLTLPLWETQTVVAIAIAHQKSEASNYQTIEEAINKTLKINSVGIRNSAISLAKDIDSKKIKENKLLSSTKDTLKEINLVNTTFNTKDKKKLDLQIKENENLSKGY